MGSRHVVGSTAQRSRHGLSNGSTLQVSFERTMRRDARFVNRRTKSGNDFWAKSVDRWMAIPSPSSKVREQNTVQQNRISMCGGCPMHTYRGFTMTELIIVLAVVAILVSLFF